MTDKNSGNTQGSVRHQGHDGQKFLGKHKKVSVIKVITEESHETGLEQKKAIQSNTLEKPLKNK
ncbi:hypothetical protein GWK17_05800 [Bacillus selenatarsenatis]|uniref:Uncharacterized protein n=1 Tax=Mesobacillus selenatarsenatis TaxID=388741 RepID=A0A846TDY0_9BACI|nr:hypothetical protein [Mesobacillus selenatarsenatis]